MNYLIQRFGPFTLLTAFVIITLFSPYVLPRIRIDHILLFILLLYFFFKGSFFRTPGVFIFLYFAFGFFITFIRIIFFDNSFTRLSPFLEYLEWIIRGLIIFEFVNYLFANHKVEFHHFIKLSKVWIFSCIAIGFIGLLQIYPLTSTVVNNFLGKYYINPQFLETLIGASRITSITGQPGSYGQIFLCGIVFILFLRDIFHHRYQRFAMISLLIILSFLSLSKNIFLGLPIVLGAYLFLKLFNLQASKIILLWSPLIVLLIFLIYVDNSFFIYIDEEITTLLSPSALYGYEVIKAGLMLILNPNVLFEATIGVRYFESQSADVDVLLQNIFFGVGFTEHRLRLSDSGYTPFLLVGGIVGYIFLIFYYLSITMRALAFANHGTYLKTIEKNQLLKIYILILLLFTLIAIGQQTFTLDKSGDLFFILSAMLANIRSK